MEADETPNDRYISGHPIPPEPNRHLPLDLYFDRDVLIEIVQHNIAAIAENAPCLDQDDEGRAETTAMLIERECFLAWLLGHPGPNVYLALYPLTEDVEEEA
jgi:hypothetical protein